MNIKYFGNKRNSNVFHFREPSILSHSLGHKLTLMILLSKKKTQEHSLEILTLSDTLVQMYAYAHTTTPPPHLELSQYQTVFHTHPATH